ncbi:CP family cyanate transporter-like MFS transporter [Nocardioides thalensis]|uniref:CP family cyanate transporter-like MFS transporter n=1 Tax=Nocardioides thalensis TaxID=1914755 RepID=A0A853C7J9_9ACTN|nr:MFS transporter [Nocardioides thalensis]NYJ02183.1 CP family cyanate transporter-like MFS transporter [Nocardioides thalensis]
MSAELHHPRPRVATSGARGGGALLLVAVLLIALNLRLGITSVGALLDRMEDDGLPTGVGALLTSLPVLCFAVVGATGMALARRVGVHRGLAVALLLLGLGLVVRVLDGPAVLVAGTFVACSGIAVANVLLPAVVKEHFPTRVGQVTGAYSAVLSLGAAFAAAASVPAADAGGGWQAGLVVWALVALVAFVAWLPWCRVRDAAQGRRGGGHLWRSPVAWAVTAVFGSQSVFAYVAMSWLPSIYADAGFSDASAALHLSVSILVGVPVYFIAPSLAIRLGAQGHLIAVLSTMVATSFVGLAVAPVAGSWLWAVLMGVGGAVFPVSLTMFALRTRTATDTAALSGMAQSVGYLGAAAGPFTVGLLSDATGSWTLPCLLLAGLAAIQVVVGYVAGRPVVIGEESGAVTA